MLNFVKYTVNPSTFPPKAYNRYINAPSMAISFPDFFGYPEDEFEDSRERLDVVVDSTFNDLGFTLVMQEDTVSWQ